MLREASHLGIEGTEELLSYAVKLMAAQPPGLMGSTGVSDPQNSLTRSKRKGREIERERKMREIVAAVDDTEGGMGTIQPHARLQGSTTDSGILGGERTSPQTQNEVPDVREDRGAVRMLLSKIFKKPKWAIAGVLLISIAALPV